jgi:hypothetical protein
MITQTDPSQPILTGSTIPGIHPIPIQMATTKAKHGRHLKSIWTTAASWFSNIPDPARRVQRTPPPKEFLAKRLGELRSLRIETAVKSPESAVCRRGLGILLTETPPTDAPKHLFRPLFPRNPFFPCLRSGHRLFQGPPAESNFLAVSQSVSQSVSISHFL